MRLLDLTSNELYGALLALRDGSTDPDQLEKWGIPGGRTFQREASLKKEMADA